MILITSADLAPDKEYPDPDGNVRRIKSIDDGKVYYTFFEKGNLPGQSNKVPIWHFLRLVNGRI